MNTITTLAFLLLTFYSTYTVQGSDLDYDNIVLPNFTAEEQTYTVQEGGYVNISCAVSEPTPNPLIVKKFRGLDETLLFVGENKIALKIKITINNGVMEIRNATKKDAGEYKCYFQTKPVVELTHKLDVQYAPTINSTTLKSHMVNKGDSVTLKCEVEGNPVPNITWSHNDGHLPAGSEEEGLSMTLLNVDRHAEGTYTCKADNGIGRPATEEMSISVEYPPDIVIEKTIIYTGVGDKAELVCIVYSRPTAEVTWQKNGSSVDQEPNTEESEGGHRHTLMLEKITEDMLGDYTCHAKNTNGETGATINLTDLPKAPNFTSDANGGEEKSYTLAFETESYYPITEYQIKYRKTKANESSEEPGSWVDLGIMNIEDVDIKEMPHSLKYTIEDLEEATEYEVVTAVKNKQNWSNESSFLFSTKKDNHQGRTFTSGSSSLLGESTSMPQGRTSTSGSSSLLGDSTSMPQGRTSTSGSSSLQGVSTIMPQGRTVTSGCSSLLGASISMLVMTSSLLSNLK